MAPCEGSQTPRRLAAGQPGGSFCSRWVSKSPKPRTGRWDQCRQQPPVLPQQGARLRKPHGLASLCPALDGRARACSCPHDTLLSWPVGPLRPGLSGVSSVIPRTARPGQEAQRGTVTCSRSQALTGTKTQNPGLPVRCGWVRAELGLPGRGRGPGIGAGGPPRPRSACACVHG